MISECNNLMIQQILCCKTRPAIIKSLEYWWQFFGSKSPFFSPTQPSSKHTKAHSFTKTFQKIPQYSK